MSNDYASSDKIDYERQRKLVDAQIKSAESASEKGELAKQKTEFARYKQDCRKRALEQAHYTASGIAKWLEEKDLKVIQMSGDKKNKTEVSVMPSELVKQEIILPIADKYYNWLISIP